MRVTCNTIDEFIENLAAEAPGSVFQNVIRTSRTRRALTQDKYNVKFEVTFQATAVIDVNMGDDVGQYLLEAGEICGIDYEDASQENGGTEKAYELRGKIVDFCRGKDLDVRPGVIDM
jgi:hypothetical protein